jgi:hypothetical protein
VKVDREFRRLEKPLMDPFLTCAMFNLDLSLAQQTTKYKVAMSEQEKNRTKSITFFMCGPVEFIPLQLLKLFPNLNGVAIVDTNIPIVKYEFLKTDFKMIQHLGLVDCEIKEIEETAFSDLPNLKWIDLRDNRLREIQHKIFANNPKMEYINVMENKIKILHPQIFDSFEGQYLFLIDEIKSANTLEPFFENYVKKYGDPRPR